MCVSLPTSVARVLSVQAQDHRHGCELPQHGRDLQPGWLRPLDHLPCAAGRAGRVHVCTPVLSLASVPVVCVSAPMLSFTLPYFLCLS